ncbi:pentatricopeptide repeat-containing protein, putative [Ricinus communis]|uniref:Pentatricopeptide repeat-containing protein, putative n=1 Tax=Ricinus communis TaxID=3988 RepID=B9T026_RICCO|nr:pentatricopeptide repeat-containing protein, putative [Ricinus communis]
MRSEDFGKFTRRKRWSTIGEKIFEEWESRKLKYDIRIPNILISTYLRKGLMEKAETFVNRAISEGRKPDAITWYYLATGYLQNNQTEKAVEMMKKALEVSGSKLKSSSESLASCLEYLKGKGDLEKAEELIKLLLDNDIISLDIQEKLLNNIRAEKSQSDAISAFSDNSIFQSELS